MAAFLFCCGQSLSLIHISTATGENWRKTLDQFRDSNRALRQSLAKLDANKLDELTAAGKRTFYGEAHGIIEHHAYHLGQIALLRRMQA